MGPNPAGVHLRSLQLRSSRSMPEDRHIPLLEYRRQPHQEPRSPLLVRANPPQTEVLQRLPQET